MAAAFHVISENLMRPLHMKTLLGALVALLTLGGLLAATPTAYAAAPPVIISPTEGQVIDGDFAGPITVDFTGVTPGTWTVGAFIEDCNQPAGTSRCASWAQVDVTAETGRTDVTLPETLGRSGDYYVEVMRTGVESTDIAQSRFTIINATDDTTPAPDPEPEGGGRIIAPAEGGTVANGFRGPVVVDFDPTSQPVSYMLWLYDSETMHQVEVTSSGGRERIAVPALKTEGAWTIDLYRADTGAFYDRIWFSVEGPAPVVSVLSVSPETFYPVVRDGYRDSVSVRYRVDQRATISYRVRNADGRVVASDAIGRRPAGANSFTWNGRNRQGEPVGKGRYRIEITAANDEGVATTAKPVAVVATTEVVTRRGSDSWRGMQTDRRSKRGNCFFRGYGGELTLDCWAGNYARAEYDFRIPANATDLRYTVRGERNCCDDGKITFSGKRVSKTRFTTAVTVTYWRSYTVRRVDLFYRYQVRR